MRSTTKHAIGYGIIALGIAAALFVAGQTAQTAKDLQQARFEDQQKVNARLDRVDKRQDTLGCTLESFQRRHPELFRDANGPLETVSCEEKRDGGAEPSTLDRDGQKGTPS